MSGSQKQSFYILERPDEKDDDSYVDVFGDMFVPIKKIEVNNIPYEQRLISAAVTLAKS